MISISATMPSPPNISAGISSTTPATVVNHRQPTLVQAGRPDGAGQAHPVDHGPGGAPDVDRLPAGPRPLGRVDDVSSTPYRRKHRASAGPAIPAPDTSTLIDVPSRTYAVRT